jgi:hypothetical protein
MQALESHLVQVERERIDLVRIVQEFERKAKLSQQQAEHQMRGGAGGSRGESRGGERRREQHERSRKEEQLKSLSGTTTGSGTEMERMISSLEELNSLPIETLSTLSLDQVSQP